MTDHYSYSRLRTWKRCPRQYFWRYDQGIIAPPKAAMTAGKTIHVVAERQYRDRMVGLSAWKPDTAAQCAVNEWNVRKTEVDWLLEDGDAGKWTDALASAATHHSMWIGQGEPPIMVEEKLEFTLADLSVPVVAVPDVIAATEDGLLVREIKTRWKKRQTSALDLEQLMLYQHGIIECGLSGDVQGIVDNVSTDGVAGDPMPYSPAAAQRLVEDFRAMHAGIQAGAWVRNTDGWWCGERWCGYHSRCMAEDS